MTLLVDTSLWVDFTRSRSPLALKQFIAPYVLNPTAHLAEPVRFEVLRAATGQEARQLQAQFASLPLLATPENLWQQAIDLGQACRQIDRTLLSQDLLIAAVALHLNAVLVTFDADFETIASVSALRLNRLTRPA